MNILDKEEFRIKLEEINRLVEKKNYKDAMEVVDSIDWRRVKNVHTLCVVGEIYAANKRYDDSREIFLGLSQSSYWQKYFVSINRSIPQDEGY